MRHLPLLVLAACAHTPDLPLRPDPARGSTFVARDGTQLWARGWHGGTPSTGDDAAQGQAKAVVVIMHGLKDYAARYDAFAQKLAAHGYDVYAFDLRGHGRSAGPRVAPDHWTDYVDDLDRFLSDVEKRAPGKPVFLFGHSMGGAIAARTAEVHTPKLAGLVLSGPALAVDAPPLLVAVTRLSGLLSPGAPALKLPNGDFSSDPANEAAMDRDELIEQGAGPAKTAAGLVEGMHAIWTDADALTMPVLALHGTADRLTAPSGSRALIERIPAQDKTLRIYDGYFHDLVHEPAGKGAKVEDDIVAWIDAHTGGAKIEAPPIYDGDLAGDPRGWTQRVEIAAGVARRPGVAMANDSTGFAGQVVVDIARHKPLGWYGNLDAHLADGARSLALRPLGLALGLPIVAVGVTGGMALVSGTQLAYSGKAWFDAGGMPLVHLGAFATFDRSIDRGTNGFDDARYGASLRLPSDRYYWPGARAGVGPVLVGGRDCARPPGADFACGWYATLGLELFGAD